MAAILQSYADRGVFRGFSRGAGRNGKAAFKVSWHRNRSFDLIVDTRKKTMSFPLLLPELPAASSLFREFREFIASRQSKTLPEHRRIDPRKARVSCRNRGGNVSLTLTLRGAEYEYGIRKLIHLAHEVFLVLLAEGPFYEYQIEAFDLDPDRP